MKSGKKSKSKSASKGLSKYNYDELAKIDADSIESCNFYGVIVDATFPYKVSKDRYICSLKVIDPTNKKDPLPVVIYAKSFKDLPIVHRVGDIIRIHRANVRTYNNAKQFNVNVYFKGSWDLYSCEDQNALGVASGYGPYSFSGKKSSQEKQDQAIV